MLECDRFSLLCHLLCIIWTMSVIVISKPWRDKKHSASKLTRNQYDQTPTGFAQTNQDPNSVTSILEQTPDWPECILVDPSCFDHTLGSFNVVADISVFDQRRKLCLHSISTASQVMDCPFQNSQWIRTIELIWNSLISSCYKVLNLTLNLFQFNFFFHLWHSSGHWENYRISL